MKLKQIITAKPYIVVLLSGCLFAACSKMDSTYIDFIKKGSITYVGTPDSIKVYPGQNRLKIAWKMSDPTAVKANIYWNNKSDSLIVPISLPAGKDRVEVTLNNLKEAAYSFSILMLDKDNNKSVLSNAIGKVYGDAYISTLLARPVKSAIFENAKANLTWGAADQTVVATEIVYKDKVGTSHTLRVPVDAQTSQLDNYDIKAFDSFQYRTLYVPDSLSLDTFYSASQTVKVTGPPSEYARTTWTAGEEDYDIPSGRLPKNVLDGNTTTIWHMDKTRNYPHTISIDMKTVNVVNGFTYVQRTPLDGAAKLVEIQVSSDNVAWKSLGAYTFENLGTKQFLELLEPASFRYFKMIVRSDYKNGNFTAIAEIGAYKR
ncbi:MAG: DUF4998 domain-containing protein [Bacteroidota bacterium]